MAAFGYAQLHTILHVNAQATLDPAAPQHSGHSDASCIRRPPGMQGGTLGRRDIARLCRFAVSIIPNTIGLVGDDESLTQSDRRVMIRRWNTAFHIWNVASDVCDKGPSEPVTSGGTMNQRHRRGPGLRNNLYCLMPGA